MPRRFIAENQLMFTVLGRPIQQGAKKYINGERGTHNGTRSEFINLVKLAAKSAIAEQGWDMTEDAIYVSVIVNLAVEVIDSKDTVKRKIHGDILPIREPNLFRLGEHIVNALEGILFPKRKYVAGYFIVKKFNKVEGVEVLVGKPKDLRELKYDLRNA